MIYTYQMYHIQELSFFSFWIVLLHLETMQQIAH